MQYIRFPELIHYLTGRLYPVAKIFPFLPPPALGSHHSTLCFYEFGFFIFHRQVTVYGINHIVF